MKKLLQILMLMLATSLPALAINPYLQGDVNDDFRVSIDDVVDLITVLLNNTVDSLDGYGDVDGDGRVNIDDVTMLIQILLAGEPENANTISVTLPEDAPITVDDVVVVGYGIEIEPSTNPRHLRETGKRYYVTDANTISVLTRDGKLVYDCYVSLDVNNHERSVNVDALETSYTMLIPAFIHVFDATPDYILNALKTMLAGLDETQTLAAAIDNSIVRRGYFEINDVETEYRAAVEKIIDKLDLRDNFLSGTALSGVSFGAPSEPSVTNGEYGFWGFKLVLNSSEWIPDSGAGGGSGDSWITARDSATESYGGTWKCNMTAYNYNRFAYTAWTRGYLDENGNVQLYSHDLFELMQHILKPQRVSTFMDNFLDPVNDPFAYESWDGLKGFISDSWKLLIDPEFGFSDMTWDNTKVKFDMEFTSPNDVVVFCEPNCPEGKFMLYYNIIKVFIEPIIKRICKDLGKVAKGETASEPDFFIILAWQLVKDTDYGYQFKNIWESESLSNREKAWEIAKLTWPKALTSLDEYVRQRIDLWTKDRCMEVLGYKAISDFEGAVEYVTKNINKHLKVVECLGDISLGLFGFSEQSGYYQMDLDFGDKLVNTKDFTVGDVTFTMVEVKGGSFLMGASMEQINDAHEDEYPLHNVTLSDYYIGQTEVTQELWKAVMGSVPGIHKNAKYPVGGVSWLECQQFIAKLNEMTGETFRLPTEAEWEYAARGGSGAKARLYAGSDDINHVAWFGKNSLGRPHVVAEKLPNPLALYDMSGNAMEWCSDWYGAYNNDAQINPIGSATGDLRVCRGGGWSYGADLCRVSCRNSFAPGNSMNENLGLRLVWESKNEDEHEWVDLGLPSGTLWATMNVGASSIEEYGDYFAWGETAPKEFYGWENYKWCNGSWNSMTKYCTDSYYGTVDNKRELDPEDDAAYVNWGPSWRMPSQEQYQELEDNCTWQWSSCNGVNGRLVTGPNGNTMFLPAAGDRWGSSFYGAGSDGYYWSRSINSSNSEFAYTLSFYTGNWGYWNDGSRDDGFTVRAVRAPEENHDYVDLGLPSGTLWATCNVGANAPEEYGDYFAWGETSPKDCYDWSTYKWGNWGSLTKYCTDSDWGNNGYVDNKTELDPEDDVAYVNWGPSWCMPTKEQQDELCEKCTWTWTTQNGVNGQLFTGPNGNTMFLPASGDRYGYNYGEGGFGYIWSRTLYTHPAYAYRLYFDWGGWGVWSSDDRNRGFAVRAVRVSQN